MTRIAAASCTRLPRFARARALAALLAMTVALSAAANPSVERRVRYAGSGEEATDALDRSYDLHRPEAVADGEGGGALVIFVHGRFWRERQADRFIEDSFVPGLLREGHSVAILRHRLLPEGRHPTAVRDVARGVAAILDRVEEGAFDANRVFLVGHSSGAQLALLLVLDPAWLAAEGKSPSAIAGVVSISGILDLAPDDGLSEEEEAIYAEAFPDRKARLAASPVARAVYTRPAILLLTAARDVPGYRGAALRLADALRASGPAPVEAFVANGRDHLSILALGDPRNDARRHVMAFLESDPRSGRLPEAWRILATWRDPPITSEDFHTRFADLVEDFPADEKFHRIANRPFKSKPGAPRRLVVRRYAAIDLFRLLEAVDPSEIGKGGWLELRNARGEWASFELATLRELSPRVVVGVDGETNLFRAADLYHTTRRYSWVEPEPKRVDMARPLGAFLFFPGDEPTVSSARSHFGRYALTTDSFRLTNRDPLLPLADLPQALHSALTDSIACVACHRFRDVGGRALHIRAADGVPMGGHALPLERYPEIVWKRFVFDQARVAEEVGASPIDFDPEIARALYDLIVREREARGVEPWTNPERDRTPR